MTPLVGFAARLPAALLAMITVKQFLPVRRGFIRHLLFFLACYFGTNTIIMIGDPMNMLLILPVLLLSFFFCCEGSVPARLTMGVIFFSISASISASIDTGVYCAGYRLGIERHRLLLPLIEEELAQLGAIGIGALSPDEIGSLGIQILARSGVPSLLRLAVWAIIWPAARRARLAGPITLSPRLWRLVDALALFPFVTVFSMVALQTFETVLDVEASLAPTLTILPFAALGSLGLLYAVTVLNRHEKLEEQQLLWQVRSQYYEVVEQSQTQVRHLRHDMANHLHTMEVLDDQSMRSYLRELLVAPALTGAVRVCDNDIVNAVITGKAVILEEAGIQARLEADVPKELPVADIDLCALFANALDNAIEACSHLPEEARLIRLRSVVDKGLLMVWLENAAAEPPIQENGRIITSKKNRASHGFGLASIRDIAERYNGTVEINYADGMFSLICTLTLSNA